MTTRSFGAVARPLNIQDFLIKLDMKPSIHIVETSIFSINCIIVKPTKIMNRADKNWAKSSSPVPGWAAAPRWVPWDLGHRGLMDTSDPCSEIHSCLSPGIRLKIGRGAHLVCTKPFSIYAAQCMCS